MTRFAKIMTALATAALAAGFAATPVMAQDATPPAQPQDEGYHMPADFSLKGSENPDDRKPLVRVNGSIITGTDIDQRLALWMATNKVKLTKEQKQELRMQILRSIIDEKLQVQKAASQKMAVTADDVQQEYDRIASQRFQETPAQLTAWLTSIGSSPRALKQQIKGEIAWSRLQQRNIAPFVNVSATEVQEMEKQLKESKGKEQYRIGEIFLSDTPSTRDQVLANAQQIVQQLKNGGSFQAYARQFSDASTAAVGGDLGWIQLKQLQNPTLEAAAKQMSPGQLAGPIEIPGGFSLLLLIDKRKIGMPDPRDAVLKMKQISLDFPKGTTKAEAQAKAEKFAEMVKSLKSCANADAKAKAIGASVVDADQPARRLPDALQNIMLGLKVGQSTPPFGSLDQGVRVLMLCGRTEPPDMKLPSAQQLMDQLRQQRIQRRSRSYMRDLRSDAVITYN